MSENLKSQLNNIHKRAKKHLGQNYLTNTRIFNFIVEKADLKGTDTIIEVGAGPGTLTTRIAPHVKKVIAIEIDQETIPLLRENTKTFPNIEIIQADILKWEVPDTTYKVIANIPYYITSPILKHFLIQAKKSPKQMILMVQKEIADKICDERKQSVLSLQVQVFGKPRMLKKISRNDFSPAPKVDSALLSIEIYKKPLIENSKLFINVAKKGFAAKRKKLIKNLSGGLQLSCEQLKTIFQKCHINENTRAEDVKISQWKNLIQNIEN